MSNFIQYIPLFYALSWAIINTFWQGLFIYLLTRIILHYIPDSYAKIRYYSAILSLVLITILFISKIITSSHILHTSTDVIYLSPRNIGETTIRSTTTNNALYDYIYNIINWYTKHSIWIAMIYITGITLFLSRLAFNLIWIYRLKSTNVSPVNSYWLNIMNSCITRLGISKQVQIFFSSHVDVPMVMGIVKPVILIPIALASQMSTQQAEAIILHELSHIKRNDYLINILQMVIETLLFFNPFVWLISSTIRQEREKCCDDMVVKHSADKIQYVKALTALETFRQSPTSPMLGVTGSKNILLNRIKRIMEMKQKNINYSQLAVVVISLLLLISTVTFIGPVVQAQTKKDKREQPVVNPKKKTIQTGTSSKNTNSNTSKKIIISNQQKDNDSKDEAVMQEEALNTAMAAMEEAKNAMKQMDIKALVSSTLDSIDLPGLLASVTDSIKSIDWKSIQNEVQTAMKEAKLALADARIEMQNVQKGYSGEIAEAKEQIEKAQKQIAKAQRNALKEASYKHKQVIAAQRNAKIAAQHASDAIIDAEEISKTYDQMLSGMEKDGLINPEKGYKIEKDGKTLYIDGIKQSGEVFKKYAPYFQSKDFTIKGDEQNIDIIQRNKR